jgi:hypothetical protein
MITNQKYEFPQDQHCQLQINDRGITTPRLLDLDPQNSINMTLFAALYPNARLATVTVPTGYLSLGDETAVMNAMANIVYRGVKYRLIGASGSAKEGRFYFVDEQHYSPLAARFQHWPESLIVYFGILVSPCQTLIEDSNARIMTVPDGEFGTNDCRGYIRDSVFREFRRVRKVDGKEKAEPLDPHRLYQFRLAFEDSEPASCWQAKGLFKVMSDRVADALGVDIILPHSAIKPELKEASLAKAGKKPTLMFRGRTVVGIREVSRELEYASSYTLLVHAPDESLNLEVLPKAIEQAQKVSESAQDGNYAALVELLGKDPSVLGTDRGANTTPFGVVEAMLVADGAGNICRHPYINRKLNEILARWAFWLCTSGGFYMPAFMLGDDGVLVERDGKVYSVSDWIPENMIATKGAFDWALCVRYPIRMYEDLLPVLRLSLRELVRLLQTALSQKGCALTDSEAEELVKEQVLLDGACVLHSSTAKMNGGDFDGDQIALLTDDRFPRWVEHRFSLKKPFVLEKTKAKRKKTALYQLECTAMAARGNSIGRITDLISSCLAAGKPKLAKKLVVELQNALDALKHAVQPDQKFITEVSNEVKPAAWLAFKDQPRVSSLPEHLDVPKTDRIGRFYNEVRNYIGTFGGEVEPLHNFRGMIVGPALPSDTFDAMLEECRKINRLYGQAISHTIPIMEKLTRERDLARAAWEVARQSQSPEVEDLLRAYQAAKRKHRRVEAETDDSLKAMFAFIRLWAHGKPEKERRSWCLALHTLVCRQRSSDELSQGPGPSGSIVFLAFPEELVAMQAERTGGRVVPLTLPKPRDGWIRVDEKRQVFLVQPIRETLKHSFLFQITADDRVSVTPIVDAAEGIQPPMSAQSTGEEPTKEQQKSTAMTATHFVQHLTVESDSERAKTA